MPPAAADAANAVASNAAAADGGDEAGPDDDTTPMAVVLGDKSESHQFAAAPAEHGDGASSAKRARGPFEPPDKPEPDEDRGTSSAGTSDTGAAVSPGEASMSGDARASVWTPTAAKMAQIRDLYMTAEAIGDDALNKNFEVVSDRQRQLIKEYFDQVAASHPDG
jgi:hypothetical protein